MRKKSVTGVVLVSHQRNVDVTFMDYLLCLVSGFKEKKILNPDNPSLFILECSLYCLTCLSLRSYFDYSTKATSLLSTSGNKTTALQLMIMKQLVCSTLLAGEKDRLCGRTKPPPLQRLCLLG